MLQWPKQNSVQNEKWIYLSQIYFLQSQVHSTNRKFYITGQMWCRRNWKYFTFTSCFVVYCTFHIRHLICTSQISCVVWRSILLSPQYLNKGTPREKEISLRLLSQTPETLRLEAKPVLPDYVQQCRAVFFFFVIYHPTGKKIKLILHRNIYLCE